MENYSVVIIILAVMIGLSAIADKVRLPYPILLVPDLDYCKSYQSDRSWNVANVLTIPIKQ